MKRSRKVELTVMLATAASLTACAPDDRTANTYSAEGTVIQSFNYETEKKMRITCDKPEDFSLPECHKPDQYKAVTQTPSGSSSSSGHSHVAFIYYPWFHPYYYPYGSAFHSSPSSYGSSTASSRSYAQARTNVQGMGLTSMYKASTVNPSSFRGAGSISAGIASRSSMATVSRGGFGATGRAFSAAGAHAASMSAGG